MKLFSNFNTNLRQELYDQACEKFGDGKVLTIRRDSIYLWLKVVIPLLLFILVFLFVLVQIALHASAETRRMGLIIWSIIGGVVVFLMVTKAIVKCMDYYMDFIIVTPLEILAYDQHGLFDRRSRSLDLSTIKAVNIEKKGLLRSIFNYGTVVFFSEGDTITGDEVKVGLIRLNYIKYPRKFRSTIIEVIKANREGDIEY